LKNVFVNKEKKYAVIWYPKCACTTISDIFCLVNDINFNKKESQHLSLSWVYNKYRYNAYLQNIDIISFVRNPYDRFLSTFIDKHVFKNEEIYLTFPGYQAFTQKYENTLYNLYKFLSSGGYITQHCVPISTYYNNCPYFKSLNKKYIKIEDDLNKNLYDFFKKYYSESHLDSLNILNYYTNNNFYKTKQTKETNYDAELIKKLKHCTTEQWSYYLSKYNLNYKDIIETDEELRNLLYKMYENDFIELNYSKF